MGHLMDWLSIIGMAVVLSVVWTALAALVGFLLHKLGDEGRRIGRARLQ